MNARILTILQGLGIAVVAGAAGAAGSEPEALQWLGDAAPLLTPALAAGATFAGTVMAMAKVLPRLASLEEGLAELRQDVRRLSRRTRQGSKRQ